jgi:hypothetical protein
MVLAGGAEFPTRRAPSWTSHEFPLNVCRFHLTESARPSRGIAGRIVVVPAERIDEGRTRDCRRNDARVIAYVNR